MATKTKVRFWQGEGWVANFEPRAGPDQEFFVFYQQNNAESFERTRDPNLLVQSAWRKMRRRDMNVPEE